MGTPYIGHGYLDMLYDPVRKTLTTYYALPWAHDWAQGKALTGNATFAQAGGPLTVAYEVCYIPPATHHTSEAPKMLISPDGLFQATITTSGTQAYGYYLVLVQGYADDASHAPPAATTESTSQSYDPQPAQQSYDLLLTRVPKPSGVDTANLQGGPWKYHWGKRLPTDNQDIIVKVAAAQTGFIIERQQGEPTAAAAWSAVQDADNLREFGRFRVRGQALYDY